jgi:hypothetical protein
MGPGRRQSVPSVIRIVSLPDGRSTNWNAEICLPDARLELRSTERNLHQPPNLRPPCKNWPDMAQSETTIRRSVIAPGRELLPSVAKKVHPFASGGTLRAER